MGGREKPKRGSCAGEKGRSSESMAVRNRLMRVACLQHRAMVMLGPRLVPRAMSGSVALMQQWWSVLISEILVTTEGPADALRLGHHL